MKKNNKTEIVEPEGKQIVRKGLEGLQYLKEVNRKYHGAGSK